MPISLKIKTTSSASAADWKSATKIKVKTTNTATAGDWKTAAKAFIKTLTGWIQFWPVVVSPMIESRVQISANSLTYPVILTGKNYHWSQYDTIQYKFQWCPYFDSAVYTDWTDVAAYQTIANPATGAFNTVTSTPGIDIFTVNDIYFRFIVYGVRNSNSTDFMSISTSVLVSSNYPIGTAASAVISRSSASSYVYNVTNTGTWTKNPTSYRYQWQQNTTGSTWADISGATASSYDMSSFANKKVRAKVWATNGYGESALFIYSNEILNTYIPPTISSFTVTPGAGSATVTYSASSSDPTYTVSITLEKLSGSTYSSYFLVDSPSSLPLSATNRNVTTDVLLSGTYRFTLHVITNDLVETTSQVSGVIIASLNANNLAVTDTTPSINYSPSGVTVTNPSNNSGLVSWTNGTSSDTATVVLTGVASGTTIFDPIQTSTTFAVTTSGTVTASVTNKVKSKATISWTQSGARSFKLSYDVGGLTGSYNVSDTTETSPTLVIGNSGLLVRALSVTVYSGVNYTGTSSIYAPGVSPSATPVDRISSPAATGSGSVTYVAPATVPGTPTSLSRNLNTASKTFTWTAPSNGGSAITNYEFNTNNTGWVARSPASVATSYAITSSSGLTGNTFQVRAVNAVGSGGSVSSGTYYVPTVTAPTTSSITYNSASVAWTSVSQASYSLSVPGSTGSPFTGTTGTSVSVTGLSASTNYTPTVTVTSSTSDYVSASGSLFSTPAQSFTVTFNANGGTGTMSTQTANTATNLSAFGLTAPSGKGFSGWATSTGGAVVYTNQASYPFTSSTTLYAIYYTLPTAPSAPAPSVTVGPGTTTATIGWSAPANGGSAITSYEAQLGASGYVNIGNVLTSAITGLSPSTSYTYYVRAKNAIGTSGAGSVSFTTAAVPVPSVTQISARNTNAGPTFMSYTITCANAVSCDVRVDRAASATVAPTSTYTAGTSTLLTLSSGSGTVTSTTTTAPAGSNAWYRIRVIPYTGASRTGTAGTQIASSWKRNTATSSTTTNPSPTPFGDASV